MMEGPCGGMEALVTPPQFREKPLEQHSAGKHQCLGAGGRTLEVVPQRPGSLLPQQHEAIAICDARCLQARRRPRLRTAKRLIESRQRIERARAAELSDG